MASKMQSGSPLLMNDNDIPGVGIHKEILAVLPDIHNACRKMGLDYFPTVIEFMTYDEISEIASYGGFPIRYSHWRWGMEYEKLSTSYEYGYHRISEMVINCLGPLAPVLTRRGTIPASEVKKDDEVFSGGWRKVVATVKQQSSKTKRIKVKGFCSELVCSYDHKWLVLSSNRFRWKTARSLKKGDIIVGNGVVPEIEVNCPIDFNLEKSLKEFNNLGRSQLKPIDFPKSMTPDLAELLGVLVGDGHLAFEDGQIQICVGKDNEQYVNHLSELMEKVFGSSAHIYTKSSGNKLICFCSKLATKFLESAGFREGWIREKKEIPHTIQKSSTVCRTRFLRGLFDTDGCYSGSISLSNVSKKLIEQTQIMLLEMGVATSYCNIDNENNQIHTLRVRSSFAKRFFGLVGFSNEKKMEVNRLPVVDGKFVSKGPKLPYWESLLKKYAKMLSLKSFFQTTILPSELTKPKPLWYNKNLFRRLQKSNLGQNALIKLALDLRNFASSKSVDQGLLDKIDNVLEKVSLPYYEVEELLDGEEEETIDIALAGKHDFTAYGFITHNTDPCVIYCLDSNTMLDNIDVIAHAIGHNDFFKNNVFFEKTHRKMINKMANHASRIRKYMARWGRDTVTDFIDHCMRLQTLIDPAKAWTKKTIKKPNIKDERNYRFPERFRSKHDYMDEWVNTEEYIKNQQKKIDKQDAAEYLNMFQSPTKDVFGFLRDNAPLKPWQQDVISMLYDEAMYFAPQRMTKMINEGWASFVDYHIMAREGLAALGQKHESGGIWEYAKHKWKTLGGKWSENPYKLGFEILMDIEDRWNKGKFGSEWENCDNFHEKKNWDKKLGLGMEKVFEVRKNYNDYTLITEFFTRELCEKLQYYRKRTMNTGEIKIVDREYKEIKKALQNKYLNGGLPDIRLVDPNHLNKGWMLLQHYFSGFPLYDNYARETLTSLWTIWQDVCLVSTKNRDGTEYLYVCNGPDSQNDVHTMTREQYEKEFMT
jgi:stage V sporulation protein R